MTTRRVLVAGAILAIISLVIVLLRNDEATQRTPSPASQKLPAATSSPQTQTASPSREGQPVSSLAQPRESLEGQPALVAPRLTELSTTESPDLANKLGAPNTPPETEAGIVLDLLKRYRRLFGAYPAGENNSQFVNALLGANKTKVPLLPHDHPLINGNGELVDAWGTPFFFHQNSRTSVEVRSAGADHLMYTDDDIVAGRRPAPVGPTTMNVDASGN